MRLAQRYAVACYRTPIRSCGACCGVEKFFILFFYLKKTCFFSSLGSLINFWWTRFFDVGRRGAAPDCAGLWCGSDRFTCYLVACCVLAVPVMLHIKLHFEPAFVYWLGSSAAQPRIARLNYLAKCCRW